MLETNVVEKLETYFVYSRNFCQTCQNCEYVERCGTAEQGKGGNIMGRMRFPWRRNKEQI